MRRLKERETLAELSAHFEVSQEMISRWKGELLNLSTEVFDKKYHNEDGSSMEEVRSLRIKLGIPNLSKSTFSQSPQEPQESLKGR